MSITQAQLAKARTMRSEKLGAWFEAVTQDLFVDFKRERKFHYMRLYDTKAAGNFLPDQAGDFIAASPKDAFLVECKASAKHQSLRSCLANNVTKEQAVGHFMWNRAGHRSVFIFCSVTAEIVQLWDGAHVAACRRRGDRLVEGDGLINTVSVFEYEALLLDLFFS